MRLRLIILFSSFIFFTDIQQLQCETLALQSEDVTVIHEKELANMAHEIVTLYPSLKDELSRTLQQKVDFRPEVILVKERAAFVKMSGSGMIIAFASPGRDLIVLDASSAYTKPFTLETTLKHELCHLVLHRGVGDRYIPRWFDEGVCQWASGGIAELMADESDKVLAKAVVSGRLIPLNDLETFPADGKALILAYEESRSFIEYMAGKYGEESVLRVAGDLREGHSANRALQKNLSVSLADLEENWQMHLKKRYTWFLYLSNNLYSIIFFLAAVVTLYGFVRLLRKKRAYVDEEEEEKGEDKEM